MRMEKRRLSELIPADYNPRKALTPEDEEYQKIKNSIEKFGYVDPIIINEDGTIIGGHQRRTVLLDLGFDEVDVIVVALEKNDEKALNVALNKISGEWDQKALKDLLVELDLSEYDFTLTGFSQKELDDLIELTDFEAEVSEDGYDSEAAYSESKETESIVKPGEVWQLGDHRLMCGDSTKKADVHKLLGEERLDLVITDPPYNVNYEEKAAALNEYRPNNNGAMKIENDLMDKGSFYSFLLTAFQNMEQYMRDGAAVYVFHADIEGLTFRQAFDAAGFKLAEVLIWEKNQFVIGRQDYHWRHEPILYGWKEGAGHYFIDDRSQDTVFIEDDIDFSAMKKDELVAYIEQVRAKLSERTSIQYEKKPAKSDMHPTMKPVALVGRLMLNSSRRGEAVADFFAGSGTTLIAAEQLGRVAFAMEINPKYCDVIIDRWEEFTGKKAVLVRGGDAVDGRKAEPADE